MKIIQALGFVLFIQSNTWINTNDIQTIDPITLFLAVLFQTVGIGLIMFAPDK